MFLNVDAERNGRMVPEYANQISILRRTAIWRDEWLIEMDERDESFTGSISKNKRQFKSLSVTVQKLFASDTKK